MRVLSLVALLGIPFISGASFDLMLIPSNAGNSIHRYDPINNVTLGSFTHATGTINSVAAVSGSSKAMVCGSTSLQAINYHTGERLSSSAGGSFVSVLNQSGTSFAMVTGTNARRVGIVDPVGIGTGVTTALTSCLSIAMSNPALGTGLIIGRDAAGNLVISDGNALSISSGDFSAFQQLVPVADVVAGSSPGQLAVFSSHGQKRIGFVYRSVAAGGYRLLTSQINSDGTLPTSMSVSTVNLTTQFSQASTLTTVSVVAGHDGAFLVGADASGTGTRVIELLGPNGTTIQSDYLVSSVTAPMGRRWHMANVVAPEPGTMAVLGFGLIPLLRKRRI